MADNSSAQDNTASTDPTPGQSAGDAPPADASASDASAPAPADPPPPDPAAASPADSPAATTTAAESPATTTTAAPLSVDQFDADPLSLLSGGKTSLSWTIAGDFDKALLHAEVEKGDAPADQDVTQQSHDAQGQVGAFELSPPDGVVTYRLVVTPKGGGSDLTSGDCAIHVLPLPSFDQSASGVRKHGDTAGGTSLTAAADQVVEAYWSVKDADLLQFLRNDEEVGDPARATDGSRPLWLAGLEPANYDFKLVPGVAVGGSNVWVKDAALSFTLTLTAALAVTKLWGDPEPDDDGKEHLSADLQLAEGTKVKLHFEAAGAKQVQISAATDGGDPHALPPVDLDDNGAGSLVVDPSDKQTLYTAVALNGDAKSAAAGPVTVHFHPAENVVSPLVDLAAQASAALLILDADGTFGTDGKLRLGARDGVQLHWTVTGGKTAQLSATSLVKKSGKPPDAPGLAAHVSNDQLLTSGLSLLLDAEGSGTGIVVVDPGPTGSTEYALTVTPHDGSSAEATAKATAYVANFNVQVKMPDGSGLARGKTCVLEIPNADPVKSNTNDLGELWLWLPNAAASAATLRVLDGDQELASWDLELAAEEGVPDGIVAVLDQPAPGDAPAQSNGAPPADGAAQSDVPAPADASAPANDAPAA